VVRAVRVKGRRGWSAVVVGDGDDDGNDAGELFVRSRLLRAGAGLDALRGNVNGSSSSSSNDDDDDADDDEDDDDDGSSRDTVERWKLLPVTT